MPYIHVLMNVHVPQDMPSGLSFPQSYKIFQTLLAYSEGQFVNTGVRRRPLLTLDKRFRNRRQEHVVKWLGFVVSGLSVMG